MKTSITTVCTILSLCLFSPAHAYDSENSLSTTNAPIYDCALSGAMHGLSVAIFFGGEVISGMGALTCLNEVTNEKVAIPVKLSLLGGGVGFDFSVINHIGVQSETVKVISPNSLLRNFALGATGGVTLINASAGFEVAATDNEARGLRFELGFTGQDAIGLGAKLYAMTFQVTRM